MDRIVNVRLNADLAQAIQQFSQLNQVVTQLGTNIAGLGGGGGFGGGMGGGNPIGGFGGGIGSPGAGGGGIAPANPAQNRAPARRTPNQPTPAVGGGYTHPGITSQMFGLAQIGFAMEDYQYAGWRGVMNNVPWIANAIGNMAGGAIGVPGLGQAALLGTAIGIPLANAAYESLSPITLDSISKMFGGLGASSLELSGMKTDRLEQQLGRMSSLNFRSVQMEQDLVKARLLEQGTTQAKAYLYAPFKPDISPEAKAGMEAGLDQFKRTGGTSALNQDWRDAFSSDLRKRADREMGDWYDNSSSLGITATMLQTGVKGAWFAAWSGKSVTDEMRAVDDKFFEEKANAQLKDAYDQATQKVGEAIQSGDKRKLEEAIKLPVVPDSIRRRLREMLKAVNKAEAEERQDRADAETMAEDDRLYADAEEGRAIELGRAQERSSAALENQMIDRVNAQRGAGVAGNRYASQIGAIVRGSRTGADAASRVEEFLRAQGVDENQIGAMVTQEFQQGIQDAKDARPGSDEELWNQYSQQWIATVKSDLIQANFAAWKGNRFDQKTFDTYANRIYRRILDDLGKIGVSSKNRENYANMIYNAAFEEAKQSYGNARDRSVAQARHAGVRGVTNEMANAGAMQSLMGEMSDDLTAVYGVERSNTFMLQRLHDQQIRRRQIMMSRFQR